MPESGNNENNASGSLALGLLLQQRRKELGLSIRRTAQQAGVDFSWLARLERGFYPNPDVHRILRLAPALEVDVGTLLRAAGIVDGDALPGLATYLRRKYELNPVEIVELTSHLDRMLFHRQQHPPLKEPGDDQPQHDAA